MKIAVFISSLLCAFSIGSFRFDFDRALALQHRSFHGENGVCFRTGRIQANNDFFLFSFFIEDFVVDDTRLFHMCDIGYID